jgi:hypothetical protein
MNTIKNDVRTSRASIHIVWLTLLPHDIIYNKHKFQHNSNQTVYIKEEHKWKDKYIHYL